MIQVTDDPMIFASSLDVTGYLHGLKSNTENIKLHIVVMSPFSIKSGMEINSAIFKGLDTSGMQKISSHFQFTEYIPVTLQFRVKRFHKAIFGLDMSVGISDNIKVSGFNHFNLKKISPGTINLYPFVSSQTYLRDIFFDYGFGLVFKLIKYSGDDSQGYYPIAKPQFKSYGCKAHFNVSFIKFRGLGFFLTGSLLTGEYEGIRQMIKSFGTGFLYSPFFKSR